MRWILACVAALCAVSGCDMESRRAVAPAPPEAAAAIPDLRTHAGQTYAAFATELPAYSLRVRGAGEASIARFERSMVQVVPGLIAEGGGMEALVFSGCAGGGCLDGLSVVAIDTRTGEVFAGVSDMAGQEKLILNERLEALLRLTSPSQNWDDPIRSAPAHAP